MSGGPLSVFSLRRRPDKSRRGWSCHILPSLAPPPFAARPRRMRNSPHSTPVASVRSRRAVSGDTQPVRSRIGLSGCPAPGAWGGSNTRRSMLQQAGRTTVESHPSSPPHVRSSEYAFLRCRWYHMTGIEIEAPRLGIVGKSLAATAFDSPSAHSWCTESTCFLGCKWVIAYMHVDLCPRWHQIPLFLLRELSIRQPRHEIVLFTENLAEVKDRSWTTRRLSE